MNISHHATRYKVLKNITDKGAVLSLESALGVEASEEQKPIQEAGHHRAEDHASAVSRFSFLGSAVVFLFPTVAPRVLP